MRRWERRIGGLTELLRWELADRQARADRERQEVERRRRRATAAAMRRVAAACERLSDPSNPARLPPTACLGS